MTGLGSVQGWRYSERTPCSYQLRSNVFSPGACEPFGLKQVVYHDGSSLLEERRLLFHPGGCLLYQCQGSLSFGVSRGSRLAYEGGSVLSSLAAASSVNL